MIIVREMRADESRRFLEIHHDAVRALASKDYPPAVLDAWAPLPITDAAVERFLTNRDNEIRLIAELDGEAVGIGAIVVAKGELRACYVAGRAARQGVGSAIVAAIERIAIAHGLTELHLESSLTAELFYARAGYSVEARSELTIGRGVQMSAVKMRKAFR